MLGSIKFLRKIWVLRCSDNCFLLPHRDITLIMGFVYMSASFFFFSLVVLTIWAHILLNKNYQIWWSFAFPPYLGNFLDFLRSVSVVFVNIQYIVSYLTNYLFISIEFIVKSSDCIHIWCYISSIYFQPLCSLWFEDDILFVPVFLFLWYIYRYISSFSIKAYRRAYCSISMKFYCGVINLWLPTLLEGIWNYLSQSMFSLSQVLMTFLWWWPKPNTYITRFNLP